MRGLMLVDRDTVFKGRISNGGRIEIYGYVDGEVSAGAVIVHEGGKLIGKVRSDSADVSGLLQGEIRVKNLVRISRTGSVSGDVIYGALALEEGGDLSAEVRNVPPTLSGDFNIVVRRGRTVGLTREDIDAVDPDDSAADLVYSVTNPTSGFISLKTAPAAAVDRFTQADIEAGRVVFTHDGSSGSKASFDVIVADQSGATSGTPKTVSVTVLER
jgi:cytoskeletal protein CcmA (bactofilin family)